MHFHLNDIWTYNPNPVLAPWCEILLFMSRNYTEWIQITYTFIIFIYDWAQFLQPASELETIKPSRFSSVIRVLPSCAWKAIKNSLSFCYDRTTFINGMSRVKDCYRELLRAVLAYLLNTLPTAQQKRRYFHDSSISFALSTDDEKLMFIWDIMIAFVLSTDPVHPFVYDRNVLWNYRVLSHSF